MALWRKISSKFAFGGSFPPNLPLEEVLYEIFVKLRPDPIDSLKETKHIFVLIATGKKQHQMTGKRQICACALPTFTLFSLTGSVSTFVYSPASDTTKWNCSRNAFLFINRLDIMAVFVVKSKIYKSIFQRGESYNEGSRSEKTTTKNENDKVISLWWLKIYSKMYSSTAWLLEFK